MVCDKVDEAIEKLFETLLNGYKIGLEASMTGSFICDFVHLLYNKCHKIDFERGRSIYRLS